MPVEEDNLQTLNDIYLAYLDCLNRQAFDELGTFVADNVEHNGRPLGLSGYRDMLVTDFADIPDLRFEAEILVSDATRIAARLTFDCTPRATFMGLPVDGRKVEFCEHVFYEFEQAKIRRVWSVIDKAAIERQIA
ncbi:conserved hypothetical protein; NTF2-like [Agrobacterium genomosp. 2 str. CFBP 5494]|uniref:Ester cyclase n=1 Tax=Agrobacterium genomosp. 2 str. CFBP 5494 TaxID=1183436 RepID=A0A9W5B4D9_9HYPH|nr:ester cyclase [Rhizobium sp. P007]CAD7048941.1 ester cyclase [Rhizobium sp. P007]CUW96860.1 conserved hypothetical protein; NTF2-like [Agrobacterium genomosp. 2 str. CFBP 5494]